ncbi:TRAP transporter large permease [Bordetella trematum]|uniref:TRAP transporter large permease n=1 Tax=Bordetella trematum TaxID=123899 RepID=UPI000D860051|nr:TRAP transporter large permease subunit [Bordetella trematum]SPU49261.1 TRAP dicarboxylate transporter subunit DctM [Bordetella trematum]VDH03852.1 Neu5Ac permease [Bordetella trematum]
MGESTTLLAGLLMLVALLLLLASGLWVSLSLLAISILGLVLFTDTPVGTLVVSTIWDGSWSWAMTALPLFIWMGEILARTRLSEDMFKGLAPWVNWLPGRLLHVNVLGCGMMAAVAGSSSVTCATVARMALPELKRRGYPEGMMLGTLAGSGTLGLMIPPSIIMIVYGVTAQQSVARLFMAGILPGLLLMALFMGYVMVWSMIHRDQVPPRDPPMPLLAKLWNSRRLIPVVLLIVAVIGTIYGGVATPTEAATFGVLGALVLAGVTGGLSWRSLGESLLSAMKISCMISFIVVCAAVLSITVGFLGIPQVLATSVQAMDLSPMMLLLVLTACFLVLGCFLEGISILVLSSAVVLPMVQAAGIDLLWFGIYIIIVIEIAQLTPPLGFNLFVLQSMTGRSIWTIILASLPFIGLLLLAVVLITVFPQIVTLVPDMMMR